MLNTNSNDEISLESLTVAGNDVESNTIENLTIEEEVEGEKIAIHIIGEVKKEGIVYLEKGSRIVDAIKERAVPQKKQICHKLIWLMNFKMGKKYIYQIRMKKYQSILQGQVGIM